MDRFHPAQCACARDMSNRFIDRKARAQPKTFNKIDGHMHLVSDVYQRARFFPNIAYVWFLRAIRSAKDNFIAQEQRQEITASREELQAPIAAIGYSF